MSMFREKYVLTLAVVVALGVAGSSRPADAQADPSNFQFNSGQTVGPVFEGWSRNGDGTFALHFGYINRNWVEEMHIPIGADNRFEPGPPDQGQPTFFYPRISRRVFSVDVPSDFGDQRLTWMLTSRGETHVAVGWLQPEWEVDDDPLAAFGLADDEANEAPTLSIDGVGPVGVGEALRLEFTVTDDGRPEPRARGGAGQSTPPTLEEQPDGPTVPVNVPSLLPENRSQPTRVSLDNVTLVWTELRGATGVSVKTDGDPQGGRAALVLTFEKPGEYLFRAVATDRRLQASEDVTITVTP